MLLEHYSLHALACASGKPQAATASAACHAVKATRQRGLFRRARHWDSRFIGHNWCWRGGGGGGDGGCNGCGGRCCRGGGGGGGQVRRWLLSVCIARRDTRARVAVSDERGRIE